MTSVDDLVEQYHAALQRQASANAAEAAAEENRKIVLSKQIIAAGDIAVSKAENVARASDAYAKAVADMDFSRTEAEEARGEVEYLRTRWETWRSKTSAAKARMTHNG